MEAPVQGESSPVQVKDPYRNYMITVKAFILQTWNVCNVHLRVMVKCDLSIAVMIDR